MHFGLDCQYAYQTAEDLWYCPCGAVNHQGESVCHACQKDSNELAGVDWELLREEAAERVAQKRAEEAALAAEKKAKQLEHRERIQNFFQGHLFRRIAAATLILIAVIFIGGKVINYHQTQEGNPAYTTLCNYIRENGEENTSNSEELVSLHFKFFRSYGDWITYQNPSSGPKIFCTLDEIGDIGGKLTATLDPESKVVSLKLTTSPVESKSYAAIFHYDIPYGTSKNWVIYADIDASSYSDGEMILPYEWTDENHEHSFVGDSMFVVNTWKENWGEVLSHKFPEMLSCLDESLQEYGLGISVADLGFTSY